MTAMGRARRGFTLWELAVVLVVMTVGAALIVPRMWVSFGDDPPPATGDGLISVLRDSRRVALEAKQVVTVHVDPKTAQFRVDTTGVAGTGLLASGVLDLGGWETLVTDLPRLEYVFWPTGAALGDTVRVRGGDMSVVVALDPWSGQAVAHAR